jgi:WD40 repeat protein
MVDKISTNNSKEINICYKKCFHLEKLYENTHDQILNYKISTKWNSLKDSNLKVNDIITDKDFLKDISHSWTAYHNNMSINHHQPGPVEGCIFQIEFSENGKYMASSNHYGTVDIWNTYNKKLLKNLNVHKEIVTGIEMFSNFENKYLDFYDTENEIDFEEEYILTSSLDKTIKLTKNLKILHTFTEHNDWIKSMSISSDRKNFLSGCISSVIKLWDFEKQKVILNIKSNDLNSQNNLNTVNTLKFFDNDNLFISAFRDGLVKIYDVRQRSVGFSNYEYYKPSIEFKAHDVKLNAVKLSKNNNKLLSSGRDNCGRLWDIRNLSNITNKIDNSKALNIYKGHKCEGFNIEMSFYNQEKNVITGSEDGGIFVYDIDSCIPSITYNTNERCVNIVKPLPSDRSKYSFIYAGLEHLHLFYCEPFIISEIDDNVIKVLDSDLTTNTQNNFKSIHLDRDKRGKKVEQTPKDDFSLQSIMEEVMKDSGDSILKLIHSSNLSYSQDIDCDSILDKLKDLNDPVSIQALENLNRKFQEKLMESFSKRMKKKTNEKQIENKNTVENKLINLHCQECSLKRELNENANYTSEKIIETNDQVFFKDEDVFDMPNLSSLKLRFNFKII